jgi:hypothetical protein
MSLNIHSNIATRLEINVAMPHIFWDTFEIGPEVTALKIFNGDDLFFLEHAMQSISFAIQKHKRVRSISFEQCSEGILQCCIAANAGEQDQPLALTFVACFIDGLAALALKVMLQAGSIGALTFDCCEMDENEANVIMIGLQHSARLEEFEFIPRLDLADEPISLIGGVLGLLNSNSATITKLRIGMQRESVVQLCEAAARSKTLESLTIQDNIVDIDCATEIVVMLECKALRELTLRRCTILKSAMALLLERLSERELLKKLSFENIGIETDNASHSELSWANLRVNTLSLDQVALDDDGVSKLIRDIAENPNIKELILFGVLGSADQFEALGKILLRSNRGPSELNIDQVGSHGAMLVDALQHNFSIKSLTIVDLDPESLEAFADGLAHMGGLQELNFGLEQEAPTYSKPFFEKIQQSLEANTTLQMIGIRSIDTHMELAKPFLRRIEYLLQFNGVGRYSLFGINIPLGIWPHVFERLSSNIDLLCSMIGNKPELVANMLDVVPGVVPRKPWFHWW